MKLGFITPNYPYEKRVAILPSEVKNSSLKIVIEKGFGNSLNLSDRDYIDAGASIMERKDIFSQCENIFSLKLIQESDYPFIREGQMIIGWTHPTGSGREFMERVAIPKKLIMVDLDNIYPAVFYNGKKFSIDFIPPNFVWKNSFYAGLSAVQHALLSFGMLVNSNSKVAILSSGNVAQGAFFEISKYSADVRMFYRKTMNIFYETLDEYDVIVNGIEVDEPGKHILSKDQLSRVKKGALLIDAAADAGNAIEGTHYTTIGDPIYEENELFFYEVNNAPSILYRESSKYISEAFFHTVYNRNLNEFKNLIR